MRCIMKIEKQYKLNIMAVYIVGNASGIALGSLMSGANWNIWQIKAVVILLISGLIGFQYGTRKSGAKLSERLKGAL